MKIFLKLPSGAEFSLERAPLEADKFYALIGLAAGALLVAVILGGIALS